MTINYSFTPDPTFSGTYTAIVYDAAAPDYGIAQQAATGPFGGTVHIEIDNVPAAAHYLVKLFTNVCGAPVNQTDVYPNTYKYTRSGDFIRNDCPAGNTGGTVTFTKDYTSNVNLQAAHDAADADTANFNTLGQAYANSTALCSAPIVSVPIVFSNYSADIPYYTQQDFMGGAPAPYANNFYSYLYKNQATGHYVFSLYFISPENQNLGNNNNCLNGFKSDNAINLGHPAPIAQITDPNLFPPANISFTGTGFGGKVISGMIDTAGRILIVSSPANSICGYLASVPTRYMMRIYNITYSSEFAAQGIFTN